MIYYPLHKYFIFNDEIRSNREFLPSENTGGIYEVIRVSDGVLLFPEEHLDRLFHSAVLSGKIIKFSRKKIWGLLNDLIAHNNVTGGNILISCRINLKAFFIPHNYPDANTYLEGISCGILHAERQNPNAKIFQYPARENADAMIKERGIYEVLLVDHAGRITEGSRSNVFFVKNDCLFTPPSNEVLLGITRQKTIQLAKELNILFQEKEIWLKDIALYEALFITGTSAKILPLSRLEKWKFNPGNRIVRLLQTKYDELIKDQVSAGIFRR